MGTKGLRRVRAKHGCYAPAARGKPYRFYPPGSALPYEWDLGNHYSAVRNNWAGRSRWLVMRIGRHPIAVATLAAATAYVAKAEAA